MFNSKQLPNSFKQQSWLHMNPVPRALLAEPWRSWVLDRGSLTQRLKNLATAEQPFSVQVNRVAFTRASLSEARAMGIAIREQVYVREVTLYLGSTPVVVARSIIPRRTLSGYERRLMHLGSKPLGEFLFRHPRMKRHPIQCKQGRMAGQTLWARRSVFELSAKPLLVSEVFLEQLLSM